MPVGEELSDAFAYQFTEIGYRSAVAAELSDCAHREYGQLLMLIGFDAAGDGRS
jgi:hypothetical protein